MIVPVPVHSDSFEEGTALAIDFRVYVNLPIPWATIAYELNDFMVEIEPFDDRDEAQDVWSYTIFFSHHVGSYLCLLPTTSNLLTIIDHRYSDG